VVTQAEVEYLHKWLLAHAAAATNTVVSRLLGRIDTISADSAEFEVAGCEPLEN
jgi:hypothetical protein